MFQPPPAQFPAFISPPPPFVVNSAGPGLPNFSFASSPLVRQDANRSVQGSRPGPRAGTTGSRRGHETIATSQRQVHELPGFAPGEGQLGGPPLVANSGPTTVGPVYAVPAFQSPLTADANSRTSTSPSESPLSTTSSFLSSTAANSLAFGGDTTGPQEPRQQQQQQEQVPQFLPPAPPPPPYSKMADIGQTSDLAQQEAAARDYKPDLQGPPVGEKLSSQAITAEYAKADPTFVAKTLALPETYSHYRPILGDGNCGWRAIGFAYFETLIRCNDVTQLHTESARLAGLSEYIVNVGGHEPWVVEDMISETNDLMASIISSVTNGQDAMMVLLDRFNGQDGRSEAIVYHLRLLASSYLKGNFIEFEPFCGGDANAYIQNTLMPTYTEIDHIGVRLLFDILLKPANMVLDIVYLDRSEGSSANTHRFSADTTGQDATSLGPVIYLLYRPGHYDILYRDSVPPQAVPTGPTSLQVHRVDAFSQQQEIQSTIPLHDYGSLDMSALAMIPPSFDGGLSPLASPLAGPALSDSFAPSPQTTWIPTAPYAEAVPAAPSNLPQQPPPNPVTNHPLRFSKYNFPGLSDVADNNSGSYEPTFTTNTFKNSHFNIAHYSNNNFQPEMYKPDADDIPAGRGNGSRKKSG